MSVDNLSEQIKDKIHDLKPKPRWQFNFKYALAWFLLAVAVLLAGLAWSVIIYNLQLEDWDWYMAGHCSWQVIIASLPYVWLIMAVLLTVAADYYLKQTKRGYLLNLWQWLGAVLVVSFIFGLLVNALGWSAGMDDRVSPRLPAFDRQIAWREKTWHNPAQGMLVGIIIDRQPASLRLRDHRNTEWQVLTGQAVIRRGTILELGAKIKIFGQILPNGNFQAVEIRPWRFDAPGCSSLERKPSCGRIIE